MLANEVSTQCTNMHQHLESILAVTRHLMAAGPQGAPLSKGCAGQAGGAGVALARKAALELEKEVAGLAANCKHLLEGMQ